MNTAYLNIRLSKIKEKAPLDLAEKGCWVLMTIYRGLGKIASQSIFGWISEVIPHPIMVQDMCNDRAGIGPMNRKRKNDSAGITVGEFTKAIRLVGGIRTSRDKESSGNG